MPNFFLFLIVLFLFFQVRSLFFFFEYNWAEYSAACDSMRNTSFASKGAVKQRPSSIMARWRFAGIPGDKTYFLEEWGGCPDDGVRVHVKILCAGYRFCRRGETLLPLILLINISP